MFVAFLGHTRTLLGTGEAYQKQLKILKSEDC